MLLRPNPKQPGAAGHAHLVSTAKGWWEGRNAANTQSAGKWDTWADKSGEGNTLTGTTTERPSVGSSGTKSWADFDGTTTRMNNLTPSASLMNNWQDNADGGYAIYALQIHSGGAASGARIYHKNAASGEIMWKNPSTKINHQWPYSLNDFFITWPTTGTVSIDADMVICVRNDITGTATTALSYDEADDKDTVGSGITLDVAPTGTADDASTADFGIGNRASGAADRHFDGFIYGGAHGDGDPTDQQVRDMMEYFAVHVLEDRQSSVFFG